MVVVGTIGLGAIPPLATFCRFFGTRPLKHMADASDCALALYHLKAIMTIKFIFFYLIYDLLIY